MSVNITFVGDVMLGENLYHFGRGIRSKFSNNYHDIISKDVKKKIIENSDYIFMNFEYSIVPPNYDFRTIEESVYRAKVESLSFLPLKHKKIANIANNHFSQYGPDSAKYTKSILLANNFLIMGENNGFISLQNENVQVKIWGVSLVGDKNYCGEYFLSDYENLIHDLYLPEKKCDDHWIISLHWGDEYIRTPSLKQIKLAHRLIDVGFDLIIGHHPHVIQSIESYKNKIIFYSLGNFIFDQNFSISTQKGLVLKLDTSFNKINIEIFSSFQNKYKISRLKKYYLKSDMNTPKFNLKVYNIKLKFLILIMSFLMKLELIYHFHKVKKEVIFILANRLLKKLNKVYEY